MAARQGIAKLTGVATGTSAKTLIQLAAATNHAIEIVEVGIGFHGTSNTEEPILVELLRQTDAGTMSALTINSADDSGGDTFDTSAYHTATVEPSAGTVLRAWTVHPQTGFVYQAHDKAPIIVGAGDRIGLRATSADGADSDSYICFVE